MLLDPDFEFIDVSGLRWDGKGAAAFPSPFISDRARAVLFSNVVTGLR
jgi:hypothetical protein